jgi:hypothetical protein
MTDQPVALTSNERLRAALEAVLPYIPEKEWIGGIETGHYQPTGEALLKVRQQIVDTLAEAPSHETGEPQWESMRAAIAREIDATKDPATKHRLIALHANSSPSSPEVAKPPCICGRGEYYHPWRFCDRYQPPAQKAGAVE